MPDLILIDWNLPGASGVEVARHLRQTSDVPIIFVTGADAAEDVHEGFRIGADDYIVKPFDPEALSERVRAVLRAPAVWWPMWACGDLVVDEGARKRPHGR